MQCKCQAGRAENTRDSSPQQAIDETFVEESPDGRQIAHTPRFVEASNFMNIPLWVSPALVVVFLGTSVYGLVGLSHERQQTEKMAATNSALTLSLSQMQKRLDEVSSQLNQKAKQDAEVPAAASSTTREPVERMKTPLVKVPPKPRVVAVAPASMPKDDPRWKEMQTRLSAQQEQLDNNTTAIGQARQDLEDKLNSTHDELNGAIAKNHDELVALEKQGERNYYEFEIDKSKQFQKVGPMGISLRKVNQKHKYYDVALMVDDQQLEKKNVNLYEPMMIRTADVPQPVEIVVNEIHNKTIKGYISEPKYKKNDLAATPAPANTKTDVPKGLQQR
jgi:hypothetical protein